MDKSEVEFLESKGFDVNGALKRFLNNEALYKKCMKKFLDDLVNVFMILVKQYLGHWVTIISIFAGILLDTFALFLFSLVR